eukprot:CAMPEP_0184065466 /NCGR_PEP_ID=MMETSP0957-20130417/2762_1 /TAXON_ID=627963 /ORGANISM="Aplanochytrium sp, Strain PBS07" /LENGTH=183 /DNA_ID=CAMNT_0026363201 /DNA_START=121 /DNA_END=672 /DNA_ORIENTATION=+
MCQAKNTCELNSCGKRRPRSKIGVALSKCQSKSTSEVTEPTPPPRPKGDGWKTRMWDNLYGKKQATKKVANSLKRDILALFSQGETLRSTLMFVEFVLGEKATPFGNAIIAAKPKKNTTSRKLSEDLKEKELESTLSRNSSQYSYSSDESSEGYYELERSESSFYENSYTFHERESLFILSCC